MTTPASVPAPATPSASSPTPRDRFVALSAALTGFPAEELGNAFDPAKLADVYLDWVQSHEPDYAPLLTMFEAQVNLSNGNPEMLRDLMEKTIFFNAVLAAAARRIMRLWYLGRWYEHEPPQDADVGPYLSATTYVRGLAWEAMQTKAIGYSEFTDQYWTKPPAAVAATGRDS